MVSGHLGIALGARGVRSSAPFWLLIIAAQAPDWVDAGVCIAAPSQVHAGLWSHSLPAIGVLGALLAGGFWVASRDGRGALLVAGLVASHYLADLLTGLKPTWPGGPVIGLALYGHPVADLVVEATVVAVGWALYRRSLPAAARRGWLAYAPLVVLLLLQLASAASALLSTGVGKC